MKNKKQFSLKTDILQIKGAYDQIFIISVVLICLLSFLEPVLRNLGFQVLSDFIRKTLHILCHQIPERCIFFLGLPIGICGRCTALYSAILLTRYVLKLIIIEKQGRVFSSASGVFISAIVPVILVLQMPVEWFFDAAVFNQSAFLRRFISGFLFGTGWILGPHIWINIVINDLINRNKRIL